PQNFQILQNTRFLTPPKQLWNPDLQNNIRQQQGIFSSSTVKNINQKLSVNHLESVSNESQLSQSLPANFSQLNNNWSIYTEKQYRANEIVTSVGLSDSKNLDFSFSPNMQGIPEKDFSYKNALPMLSEEDLNFLPQQDNPKILSGFMNSGMMQNHNQIQKNLNYEQENNSQSHSLKSEAPNLISSNPPQILRALTQKTFPPAGIDPQSAVSDNNVVLTGYLLKQNRHGRFQKRLFRFDGFVLLCLSPKRQRLPDHINLLQFDPKRFQDTPMAADFVNCLGHFYPGDPPTPALTNPLIAAHTERDIESDKPDIYTKFYHLPKWIIPASDMQSIRAVVPQPPKYPDSADGRTFLIQTKHRDYILRSINAVDYRRWTFLLSRMSKVNLIGTVPRDSIRITNDLEYPENDDDPEKVKHYTSQSAIIQALKPSLKRIRTWQESVDELMIADPESRKFINFISARYNRNTSDQLSQNQINGNGNRRMSNYGGIPDMPVISSSSLMSLDAQNIQPQPQAQLVGSPSKQNFESLQRQHFMRSPNQLSSQLISSPNQNMTSSNQVPPQFVAQNQSNGSFFGSPNQVETRFLGATSKGPGWNELGMDNHGLGNKNMWEQGSLSRAGPDILRIGKSPPKSNIFGMSTSPPNSNNFGSIKNETKFLGPSEIKLNNFESLQLTEKFPWESSNDSKIKVDLGFDLWNIDKPNELKLELVTSTQPKPDEKPHSKNRLSVSTYGNPNRRSAITGYRNSNISMISEAGNVLPKPAIQQILEPETLHSGLIHACNGLLRVLLRLQGFTGDDPQLPLEMILTGKGFPDASTPGRDHQPLLPYFKNFALKSIPYFFEFIHEYVDMHINDLATMMSSAQSVDEKTSLHERITMLRVRLVDLNIAEDEWGSAIAIVLEKRGDVPAVERAVKKNVAGLNSSSKISRAIMAAVAGIRLNKDEITNLLGAFRATHMYSLIPYLFNLFTLFSTVVSAKICFPFSTDTFCVIVTDAGNNFKFVYQAPSTIGYVAFGPGDGMNAGDIVVAWPNKDGSVTISRRLVSGYQMPTYSSSNTATLLSNESGIHTVNGKSTFVAAFTRPKTQLSSLKAQYALSSSSTTSFIWAGHVSANPGSSDPSASITKHTSSTRREVSNVNLLKDAADSTEMTTSTANSQLMYAHAILLVISWGLLAPAGIIVARFFKNALGVWWFRLHWGLFGTATLLTLVSFALIFVYVTQNGGSHFFSIHAIFGIIFVVLVPVQFALGIVIDRLFNPARNAVPIIDKAHWWLGRFVFILGSLIIIPLGIKLFGSNFDETLATSLLIAYFVYIVLVLAAMVSLQFVIGQTHHKEEEGEYKKIPSSHGYDM
ncbi:hypothetical protein HK096_007320, partial [Nowakowskiella sp. JEL0078]